MSRIHLGVTGGIAAYKASELCRLLLRHRHEVVPLVTPGAERFVRADDARSRAGSGLGLALVAELVTAYGGELRLCHGGTHVSHGQPAPVPCTHGDAMTVSVLLPCEEGWF